MSRKLLAEFLGSMLLAALVIGSGIAAQHLSTGTGLRLLENAAAAPAADRRPSGYLDDCRTGHCRLVPGQQTPRQ